MPRMKILSTRRITALVAIAWLSGAAFAAATSVIVAKRWHPPVTVQTPIVQADNERYSVVQLPFELAWSKATCNLVIFHDREYHDRRTWSVSC